MGVENCIDSFLSNNLTGIGTAAAEAPGGDESDTGKTATAQPAWAAAPAAAGIPTGLSAYGRDHTVAVFPLWK